MSEQEIIPRTISVVGVSGSPTRPSRTTALVAEVTDTFARSLGGTPTVIELAPLLAELGQGPFRGDIGADARAARLPEGGIRSRPRRIGVGVGLRLIFKPPRVTAWL